LEPEQVGGGERENLGAGEPGQPRHDRVDLDEPVGLRVEQQQGVPEFLEQRAGKFGLVLLGHGRAGGGSESERGPPGQRRTVRDTVGFGTDGLTSIVLDRGQVVQINRAGRANQPANAVPDSGDGHRLRETSSWRPTGSPPPQGSATITYTSVRGKPWRRI